MKYEMVPAISISELENALKVRFGNAFEEFYGKNLAFFLFYEDFHNDSYKRLNLDSAIDLETDNSVDAWTYNTIIDFLIDFFPEGTQYVLLDTSW